MYKLGFKEAEEPEIKLPTFTGSWRKQGSSKQTSSSASSAFDCEYHNKTWKILKKMEVPDQLTGLLRNLYAGQEAAKPDMEQLTGSKLGKEYIKLYIVTLLI